MPNISSWVGQLSRALRRGAGDTSGNVAVVFALGLLPTAGLVGAAVDYSKSSQLRSRMQQVLDSSVLAGVKETGSTQQISKATSFFNAQIGNDWGTTPSVSYSVDGQGKLTGTAQGAAKTSFVGILGVSSINVKVTAAAVSTGSTSKVCILLVDPTQSQSLLVNSGANLQAPNCEIHVRSTANPVAIFNASTTLNVKRICLKGTTVIKNGGANPPAETGCAAISDPFASSLPTVSSSTCTYNNQTYNPGAVTINPASTAAGPTSTAAAR